MAGRGGGVERNLDRGRLSRPDRGGRGGGERGRRGEPKVDPVIESTVNILSGLIENMLIKRGIAGLLPTMRAIERGTTTAGDRGRLIDHALKTIDGVLAKQKVAHQREALVKAVKEGDSNQVAKILQESFGRRADQATPEQQEVGDRIMDWATTTNPDAKAEKLKDLNKKRKEVMEEVADARETIQFHIQDRRDDLSPEQESALLDQMRDTHRRKEKKRIQQELVRAEQKLKKKNEDRYNARDTKEFRKHDRREALRKVIKAASEEGGMSQVSDEALKLATDLDAEMIAMGEDSNGNKELKLGDGAKELLTDPDATKGLTDSELESALLALKEAVNERTGRKYVEEMKKKGVKFKMGRGETMSEAEIKRRAVAYSRDEELINLLADSSENNPNILSQLGAMGSLSPEDMAEISSSGLMRYIESEELKAYLYEDAGVIKVDVSMLTTESEKKRFLELYYDSAIQAARRMFNDRVDSRGMDVYYNPAAKQYIAINAVQGIFDLDDSIKDAIKLKTTMLYMGDSMEGGYHDPKDMLGILGALEKPGKYFMQTLRRSEGIYYEETSRDGTKRKKQLCRLNLFDLQKLVEQTCRDDSMYENIPGAKLPDGTYDRRRWLTMLLRENDITKLQAVDDKILTMAIIDKMGGEDVWQSLTDQQRADVLHNYNTLVKDVILYEVTNDRIGELFENSAFGVDKNGNTNFALWQRIPEMWMKKSRVGMRAFCLKYGVGNVQKLYKYFDTLLPSFQLYRMHETMGHLVESGAVNKMFFGGQNAEAAELFAKEMKSAIITWNVGDVDSEWWQVGIKGNEGTGIRRGNNDVSERLLSLDTTTGKYKDMVESMDFSVFEREMGMEIKGRNAQEKWKYFVENYNDGYYNYKLGVAKGWPDWAGKFVGEKNWHIYEKLVVLANNPMDITTLLDVFGAISAYTKPDALGRKYTELLEEILKPVGLFGYFKTVMMRNNAAIWTGSKHEKGTRLPSPKMESKHRAGQLFGIYDRNSEYSYVTGYDTPDSHLTLKASLRELRKGGYSVDEKAATMLVTKSWLREMFLPYNNAYMNILTAEMAPVRLLKWALGFHDYWEFWGWLFGPIPDGVNKTLEAMGVKVKI